tara:strand:+ start:62 stop:973 length:912 start_codon:yes stop_codon:yes gene_type:complete
MTNKDGWATVEVPEKIEYEVEEEIQETPKQEIKPSEEENNIQELEGIETQGAQKRIRQLVKQRKEREEQIEQLLKEKEELQKSLQVKDNEVHDLNELSLNASEQQLTDKINLARAVYLEAFDEGNNEKVLKAQEALNDAQADLKAVTSAKSRFESQPKPQQEEVSQQQRQQSRPDPMAEEWASNNTWFGKDNIMTASALAIDTELKNEGFSPSDPEFYDEITKRMQDAFPQKFGEDQKRVQGNTSSPAQVVSGSSRSSPSSRSKVKLSQEDIRLASKWNIPLETYAAEKLKVLQADGEYTDIK